jgi:hypothetical protein
MTTTNLNVQGRKLKDLTKEEWVTILKGVLSEYDDSEIRNILTETKNDIIKIKGDILGSVDAQSVQDIAERDTLTGMSLRDLVYIESTQKWYKWNGTGWVDDVAQVDLTDYPKKSELNVLQESISYINNTVLAGIRNLITTNKQDIQTKEPKLPRGTFDDILDGKKTHKLFTGGAIFKRIKALAQDIVYEALLGRVHQSKILATNLSTRANITIPDWAKYITITFGDRRSNFSHRRTTISYPISEIISLGTSGKLMLKTLDGATYNFGGAYNNGVLAIQDNVPSKPNKYGAVLLVTVHTEWSI